MWLFCRCGTNKNVKNNTSQPSKNNKDISKTPFPLSKDVLEALKTFCGKSQCSGNISIICIWGHKLKMCVEIMSNLYSKFNFYINQCLLKTCQKLVMSAGFSGNLKLTLFLR